MHKHYLWSEERQIGKAYTQSSGTMFTNPLHTYSRDNWYNYSLQQQSKGILTSHNIH